MVCNNLKINKDKHKYIIGDIVESSFTNDCATIIGFDGNQYDLRWCDGVVSRMPFAIVDKHFNEVKYFRESGKFKGFSVKLESLVKED